MKTLTILICTVFLAGCVTGQQVTKLEPGMTKQQVIRVMGKPDGYSATGSSELLRYTNKQISGWSWDKADYYAVLESGKLTHWGTGTVRQNQAPVQNVFVAGQIGVQ